MEISGQRSVESNNYGLTGSIHKQLRDLPDGAQVQVKLTTS